MTEEQPITYTLTAEQWAWIQQQERKLLSGTVKSNATSLAREEAHRQADIRRRYAMCALTGFLSATSYEEIDAWAMAKSCFTIADAMIAAEGGK